MIDKFYFFKETFYKCSYHKGEIPTCNTKLMNTLGMVPKLIEYTWDNNDMQVWLPHLRQQYSNNGQLVLRWIRLLQPKKEIQQMD